MEEEFRYKSPDLLGGGGVVKKDFNLDAYICQLLCRAPAWSFPRLHKEILRSLKKFTGSKLATIGFWDEAKRCWCFPDFIRPVFQACQMKGKAWFPSLGGVFEKAFQERCTYISNDLSKDPYHRGLPSGHVPIQRVVIRPILVEDRIQGVAIVANAPQPYGKKEKEVVEKLASFYAFLLKIKEEEITLGSQVFLGENEVLETQRAKILTLLVGNLAHKFNNLLNVIWASLELTKMKREIELRPFLHKAEKATQELSYLVRQLLLYARGECLGRKEIDLTRFLPQIFCFLRSMLPPSIRLITKVRRNLPPVRIDPMALEHLLVNLVANAVEAYGNQPGRISITLGVTTKHRHLLKSRSPYQLRLCSGVEAQCWLSIRVRDWGPGIPPEELSRITEPFYSTKGLGRGLGLAAVRNILWAHEGCLSIYSRPGKGTVFKIFLPVNGGK